MYSKVSSDWLPGYIKAKRPVLEILKLDGYFPDNPRMYMVWHVDKYKITFKLVISHWTNEMSFSTHSRILFSSEYFYYKIFIHGKVLRKLK
jgi:hypothetical protein